MTTQLDLTFRVVKPSTGDIDAPTLVALLKVHGDWLTMQQIAMALRWLKGNGRADDRRIRAAAEASDGRILSGPGSPGYKLTADATPEDMMVVHTLESQARRMMARAVAIRRRWHRGSVEI